jgi:small subunit ribosomal protein S15
MKLLRQLENFFILWYNTFLMITKEDKAKAIAATQVHDGDVGSPQAQVSVLTARIKEITEHLKANKHEYMARRGLIQMVGRRKRLLKYLENTDFEAYKGTVAKLGLRK